MRPSPSSSVRLRAFEARDLADACHLSRELKWPHRPEDWEFMAARGFGVAAEEDGVLCGTALAWTYGDTHASIGMVIVSPSHQGRGLGRLLMQSLFERLGDRSIMLHATDEALPLYQRLGFKALGAIYQHQATVSPVPLADLRPRERVRPMGSADEATIAVLDRAAVGFDRSAVLSALQSMSGTVILASDSTPIGYAVHRRFGRGYSIGPVVAPDLDGARTLILHWLGLNLGNFVRLDALEGTGLSGWLDQLGLPCVGRVTRMVRGDAPVTGRDARAFTLISQAFA